MSDEDVQKLIDEVLSRLQASIAAKAKQESGQQRRQHSR